MPDPKKKVPNTTPTPYEERRVQRLMQLSNEWGVPTQNIYAQPYWNYGEGPTTGGYPRQIDYSYTDPKTGQLIQKIDYPQDVQRGYGSNDYNRQPVTTNAPMNQGGLIPYEQLSYENGGGLSRSEDYGSKKKPYPSVKSSDFAGGGRSYPIPTRADAIDALRLAGLHGREDVRAKVFKKYPGLKKEYGGIIKKGYPDFEAGGVIPIGMDQSDYPGTKGKRFSGKKGKQAQYGMELPMYDPIELQQLQTQQNPMIPQVSQSLQNTPQSVQSYYQQPEATSATSLPQRKNSPALNMAQSAMSALPDINLGAVATGIAGFVNNAYRQQQPLLDYTRNQRRTAQQQVYNPNAYGTGSQALFENGGYMQGSTYELAPDQIAFLRRQGYDISEV